MESRKERERKEVKDGGEGAREDRREGMIKGRRKERGERWREGGRMEGWKERERKEVRDVGRERGRE